MASDPQKKTTIIVGDDGTLYQFSADELQAHKLAPGNSEFESAQKLVEAKSSEQFHAESANVNTDIWFAASSQAVRPPEE